MRRSTVVALVVAAVVGGLALGTVGLASASMMGRAGWSGPRGGWMMRSRTPSGTAGPEAGWRRGPKMGSGLVKRGHRLIGDDLVLVVAKLTNETTTAVVTDLRAGKTFADIAKAKNVTVDQVVALALHAPKAALDSEVSDALITQAQADALLSRIKTRLTDEVNGTFGKAGGLRGQRRWGPRHGPGGPESGRSTVAPPASVN